GWSSIEDANVQGKKFIGCLYEAIWYIDMHDHLKLKECSYYIPELFIGFFDRTTPESYKESRKLFNAIELNLHCQALALHTTSQWILKPSFAWLHEPYSNLITTILNYVSFLNQQNEITTKNHASLTPVRSIEQAVTIKIYKRNTHIISNNKIKYRQLENALKDLPLWTPLDIENFLLADPVIFEHQSLKEIPFKTFDAATENEIIKLWETIHLVDENMSQQDCSTESIAKREFEQLHYIPDSTPSKDLYYKLFEELYSTTITEEYRPSLRDTKLRNTKLGKAKGAIKHTMPFSPSSIHAKNIGITVVCTECEKPQSFLDTIIYTCGISFHNTCDLTSTKSINSAEIEDESNDHQSNDHNDDQPSDDRQNDDQLSDDLPSDDAATDNMIARYKPYIESIDVSDEEDINDINSEEDIYDDINNEEEDINDINEEGNINKEGDINEEKDINEGENINEEEEINKEAINNEKPNVRSDETSTGDPIYELFQQVFVNDSWNCASPIKKPYYSARIFPLVCFLCGSKNVTKSSNSERPLCIGCGRKALPKKRYK
ncbi:28598_t:CDS:2, partial [Gigaspora margarita]